MSDATQALHKIARGTGIIFAGTVVSMFFGFLSRAIIAREFSKAEYGVFNLALTVLSIGLVIATLGFQNALPREVAFHENFQRLHPGRMKYDEILNQKREPLWRDKMMEIIKRELKNFKSPLYRNSIYISMTSLVTAIAGFLFWSVAARLYPSSDVGIASAIVSAINLTFTISMLGLNFSLIRFYPEYRQRAIGSSLILAIIASLVFSLIYGSIMKNSGSFSGVFSIEFLAMFVGFSVIGTAYNILSTYAIAKRKAEHSFVQSVLFALRFTFLFFCVSLGVFGIVGSFGLGLLLGLVYGMIFIDDIRLELNVQYLRDSLRFSLGNYIASIANVAPNYLMPTIVLTMLGKEEAAYFYIAFAIGTLVFFVPNAINTSFFVEGSHGLKDMRRTLKKALVFSYIYLIVVTVLVWLFGEYVLKLFRPEYVNGFGLLKLMALGGFFVVPVNFLITVLNIQKKVKEVVVINVLKAVLFLGLSYLLIPRFGIEGVGWGWIGTYLVVWGVLMKFVNTLSYARTS